MAFGDRNRKGMTFGQRLLIVILLTSSITFGYAALHFYQFITNHEAYDFGYQDGIHTQCPTHKEHI